MTKDMSTEAPLGSDHAERVRIRDAMDRLLAGAPLHSDGKLTVKSLAEEAQLKRWLLTHKHTDLQEEFRSKVEQQGAVPRAVQEALDEIRALRERLARTSADLAVERETVKRLERVVHVLTLQLDQERSGKAARSNVRRITR
jgi:uncharacterized membrane protein YccC